MAQPVNHAGIAPAAAFAVSTTMGAFVGDRGLSDAALDELAAAEDLSGTLLFGAPAPKPQAVKVSVGVANIRSGPGLQFRKIGKLKLGTAVTPLARSADWFQVSTPAGVTGWVAREVIAIDAGAAASVGVAAPAAAPVAAQRATTTGSGVNLRKGPGTNYASLGKLAKGAALGVLGRDGGWYKVTSPRGTVGWVSADFLALPGGAQAPAAAPAAATAVATASVSASRVNLRGGPATTFNSLGKMAAGARLTLLARHGDWIKVRTAKGTVGWVSGDLVNVAAATLRQLAVTNDVPAAPKAKPAAQAALAEKSVAGSGRGAVAASVAMRFVGARYVWGGASPRGFDCSGLVLYAYRQAGLALPHKASLQFNTRYGARIRSVNALRAGDIVFFANTAGRGITHVALYVGGGRMVTANSPRTGVQLQSIHSRYWLSHFAGAIRP